MICRAVACLFVVGIATASAQSNVPAPEVAARSFEVASIKQSPPPTAVATATAIGQTTTEGEIAGRITDSQAAPLPGVRITISSGDERRETTTDNDGRFALGQLTLGTYRVAADLPGFKSESGTITLTPSPRRAHIAWSLQVGCIEGHGIRVIFNARDAAPLVAAIAHIRVRSNSGPLLWSGRPECPAGVVQSYAVEVLNTVARRSGRRGDERATQQIIMSLDEVRLTPGGEYLALLWPGWGVGGELIFPIEAGRVSSSGAGVLNGMRVEEALDALGEWSRQGPR